MNRKVIILDVAKPDFREIKAYVESQFGGLVWGEVNQEFKAAIKAIGTHPETGKEIEMLKELGVGNFRFKLVRQTRIIYEYNERQVIVHMFIHTRRDFRTQLVKRLLNM